MQQRLLAAVDKGVRPMYPLRSHEYDPGTAKFREYIDSIEALLRALLESRSLQLLQVSPGTTARKPTFVWRNECAGRRRLPFFPFSHERPSPDSLSAIHANCPLPPTPPPPPPQLVVLIQCSEGKRPHVHNEQMQRMLGRFIATCTKDEAAAALDEVYLWSSSEDAPAALRSAIAERVLLPLLRDSALDAAETFFAKRITSIMSAVSEQQELRSEAAIRARMAAFSLIHVMFERLPTAKLYGERVFILSPEKRFFFFLSTF